MKKWYFVIFIILYIINISEVKAAAFKTCSGYLNCDSYPGYTLVDNSSNIYKVNNKQSTYNKVCINNETINPSYGCKSGFTKNSNNTCTKTRNASINKSVTCQTLSLSTIASKDRGIPSKDCDLWTKMRNNPAGYCISHYYTYLNSSTGNYCSQPLECTKWGHTSYYSYCVKYSCPASECNPSIVKARAIALLNGKCNIKGVDPHYYYSKEQSAYDRCTDCMKSLGFDADYYEWRCSTDIGSITGTCDFRSIEDYKARGWKLFDKPGFYCEYPIPYSPSASSTYRELYNDYSVGRPMFYYPINSAYGTYVCPSKGSYDCKQPNGTNVSWIKSGSGKDTKCSCTVNASLGCPTNYELKNGVCVPKVLNAVCSACVHIDDPDSYTPPAVPEEYADPVNMSCDVNTSTTLSSSDALKFDNSLCKVTCSDSMTANFRTAPSVYAGMGVGYPINLNGTRTCKLKYYNANNWASEVNEAVDNLSKCDNNQVCPSDQGKCNDWHVRLNELMQRKTACENIKSDWVSNPFDINGDDFYAKISNNVDNDITSYYKKDEANSTSSISISDNDSSNYDIDICTADDDSCTTTDTDTITLTNSTLNVSYNYNYIFKDYYYINKYTGKVTTEKPLYYYEGGNMFFTNTNQKTGQYNMSPILPNMLDKWTINMTCHYNLDNRLFPPDDDTNYPAWGNVSFMFRQISLTDPFPPNHVIGSNWVGKVKNITDLGQKVYDPNHILYFVNLSPAARLDIRRYNETHSYTDYDLNGSELSNFIHRQFVNLFTIK